MGDIICVHHNDFLQEIGDDLPLVTIDPASDHGDEDLQNHGDS